MSFQETDDQGLVQQLVEQEHALVRARFQHSLGRLENTASLRGIRKDIARIRTELRRREIDQGLPRNHLLRMRAGIKVERAATEGAGGGFLQGVVDNLADES